MPHVQGATRHLIEVANGPGLRVYDAAQGERGYKMPISARNQLKGKVVSVKLGTVMSEVVVDIGGQEMVAAITRDSAEALALKKGNRVTVVVKSTDVMISK